MIYMCMSALYVLFTRICVRDVKLIDSVIDKHRQHSHFFFLIAKCVINSRVEYMQSFMGEIKRKTSLVCASMKIQHGSKTRKKSWNISRESKEEERGCSQRNQWTSGPVQYPGPQSCRMWLLIGMRWWREGNRGQVVQKTQYCHVMMNI